MPIDASIALGIKPVQTKSQNEYMNELYTLRNAEQTNQMNQMKMGETQRAQAQAEDTRNFFRQPGFNIEKMTPAQDAELAGLNPDFYEKLKSKQTLQRTQESETAKRSEEIQGMYDDRYANMIKDAKTPEQVDLILEHRYKNPALKGSPFQAIPLDQIKANVPRDLSTPEGQAAFSRYTRETSLKAKDAADSKLLHFFGTGGGTQGQGKYSDSLPGTYTPNTPTTAEIGAEDPKLRPALAQRNNLAAELNTLTSSMKDLPPTQEQAALIQAKQADIAALDTNIGAMQKAQQSAKHTDKEFIDLVNIQKDLVARGLKNTPEYANITDRIAKLTHVAEGAEPLTDAGRKLMGELVGMGYVPSSRSYAAMNAAADMGVTAKQFVSGKANLAALVDTSKSEAKTGAFEKLFTRNIQGVLDAGRKLTGKSGVPIIDEYIANPVTRALGLNPALDAYDVLIKGSLNEYGKLVGGSFGTAVAQAEIKRIEKLLHAAKTRPQMEAIIESMTFETANRMYGFKATKAELLGETPPEPPPSPYAPKAKAPAKTVTGQTIKNW
jgi:hypothetical protein